MTPITKSWKNRDPSRSGRHHPEAHPHPSGVVELSDDELEQVNGGTAWVCLTVGLTVTVCSPTGTLCGSCQMGTRGCC